MSANDAWLIVLLGITSTTQTHMAKALERQGIETVDLVRARLRRSGTEIEGKVRKPLIYGVGLVLNHTTFVYHLLVAPLGGTTSLYTSMYGAGLIALLPYTTRVMKERLSRLELVGAVAILLGTLTIGIEGISRPPLDMGQMDLGWTVAAVVVVLLLPGYTIYWTTCMGLGLIMTGFACMRGFGRRYGQEAASG